VLADAQLPGIIVAVQRAQTAPTYLCLGSDAAGQPLRPDSLFPVASITKLATALAVLRLVDTGAVALDDPLARYLPEAAAAQPGVTLHRLLSHTAGLPIDVPPSSAVYAPGLDWPAVAAACLHVPLRRAPGLRLQYSNVGYGLLALLVERQTSLVFSAALHALVLAPLGIEGYLGVEPPRPPAVLADVQSSHAGTELEPFNSPFWRSLALPWACLLTTAGGALRLLGAFAPRPEGFLRPETAAAATHNQTGDLGGGPWGLGPEVRGHKAPHWTPAAASPDSFGHLGASGCLACADPAGEVAWTIFGSRTNAGGWLLTAGPAIGAAILAGAPESR